MCKYLKYLHFLIDFLILYLIKLFYGAVVRYVSYVILL